MNEAKQVDCEYDREPGQNGIAKPKIEERFEKMEWPLFCKEFNNMRILKRLIGKLDGP